VRGGITANDAEDADRILDALRDQRLPLCPRPSSEADTPPSLPSEPAGSAATTNVPPPVGTSASATSTRTATSSAEPEVNCRRAD
jgi:protein phosphatase